MSLRSLAALGSNVGQCVRDAIKAIEKRGGRHTHDSGHKVSPTWIFSFGGIDGAQLGLRINRDKLSVYLRAQPPGRVDFKQRISHWGELEKFYPNPDGEKPSNSLLSENSAAYLTPKRHRLLLVRVNDGQFDALLDAYLGREAVAKPATIDADAQLVAVQGQGAAVTTAVADASARNALPPSRVLTPEQLRRQLDRQEETGRAGELLAYQDEIERLTTLGCPDPASCMQIIAVDNTAAGYDLLSEWNGERRCIEVKTTGTGRDQFYITANECETLRKLASEAWLYRVDLSAGESGAVVMRLQDPMAHLDMERFRAVLWEVDVAMFQDGSE